MHANMDELVILLGVVLLLPYRLLVAVRAADRPSAEYIDMFPKRVPKPVAETMNWDRNV